MSKWIKFYNKLNKFDFVEMRWTKEQHLVEMTGMDSIMPIDSRLNIESVREEVRKRIKSMESIEGFEPCAFSTLTGRSILCASESPVYNL